ncbi:SDR family NAD(P)-dependent oxidoreductase [Novosphingobium sp. BW1]|uniref:SDR family NAD(P)-dependent oxidoreductase n=1 Tax=Novosphingobium sp. BW1 TaxID=2592621 RepID=UPI0011DEAA34|nr:SDR family NAD(P)-dependent oxidoreductase [Novosphingobium sp. BW1]TYC84969.1 SDR family NAD(P)-dependent oxidoreductase [Novosphingobium sp. BW1]
MARIFVTGSTQGVGRNAIQTLIGNGHDVILHARSRERINAFGALANAHTVLTGDLASLEEVRALARALNETGPVDAIIHNGGIIDTTREGILRVLMVNAIAPYMLSLLAEGPARLIFTGSSMHYGHEEAPEGIDWRERRWSGARAYDESKMLLTAMANGLARYLPDTLCHTVDPGWVPTRMGGESASDPLDEAHLTQCWLATCSKDEAGAGGGYWHHMERREPDPKTQDTKVQDAVLMRFAALSGVPMPAAASRL